ncbi:MAG TPA: sigma-70 family RNA polymerase sigma factor [Polyangiaceae bacterium]|jgi:RNA polymerase sigma-70 factor (ECF subfamily)|nr:sigma-70 family RNA polymerase sigma factor [Polyangiaceae bacterium]
MVSHSQHPAEIDDDALLVLRVGEGDVAAYRALVERYAAKLSRFAERLLRDGTEAEDVVQETFLRLWQRASEYQPKARVTTWLHRITHNLAVDRLRARGRTLPLPEEEEMPVSARQPTLLDEKRRVVALEAALAALPERQATAIVLVHLHGLTGAEAAEVLGVGMEAVESLLARGRRALKSELTGLVKAEGGAA